MSNFQIGEEVMLNGKTYKITGTYKRSFLLERDGKQYKATAKMMQKIQKQNENGIGMGRRSREARSKTYHLENRLARKRIFNPDAKLPETEDELLDTLDGLMMELSPENLSCDGELSRYQINNKYREIRATWREVENLIGRKVSEDEIENRWIAKIRNR